MKINYCKKLFHTCTFLLNDECLWFLSQVTVMNQEYMSDASERKKIYLQSTETEVDIVVNDVNTTSVSISWDAVPGVDGYMISHNQPENKLLTGNVIENTTTNEAIGEQSSGVVLWSMI